MSKDPFRHLCVALGVIAVTLVFFSPRLWLMTDEKPGTFVWDRANTFLSQVEDPFRTDIESAMKWRIAPPLVAKILHLNGKSAFFIPWIGAVILLAYVSDLIRSKSQDWKFTIAATLIVATTSAVMVPLHWYGINDSWIWLGLLVVTFSQNRTLLVASVLLAPWVDERFIIGLPLALLSRQIGGSHSKRKFEWWLLLGLLPYILIRIAMGGNPINGETERTFIATHLADSTRRVGLAPLAWWMGLRIAWIPVGYFVKTLKSKDQILLLAIGAPTVVITVVLAADMSRSAAIIIPLVLLGSIQLYRDFPKTAPRIFSWLAIASLLMPAAHVVSRKIDPVENIFVEIARLLSG